MLIERSDVMARLRDRLAGSAESAAVLVTGGIGMGKSALLREFGRLAVGDGHLLLSARCAQDEQELPLGLLGQLCSHPAVPAELADRVRERADRWSSMQATLPAPDAAAPLHPEAVLLARDLLRFLQAQSTPGLVLCIDDLHHADLVSQQVLLYLIRRMETGGLACVFSVPTADDVTLPALHAEILRHPCFEHIPLLPLSLQGVNDMFMNATADPGVPPYAELLAMSGGSPLLVKALVQDSAAAVPGAGPVVPGRSFRQSIASAVERVEPATGAVLAASAVLGRWADLPAIATLLGIAPGEVARAVESLAGAGLLSTDGRTHPATAGILLADADPAFRADLRCRAARHLDDTGEVAAVVAEHLIAAGRPCEQWAGRVLAEAAAQADAAGESGFAVDCLELAARSTDDAADRAHLVMGLARIEWRQEPSTAGRHLAGLLEAAVDGRLRPVEVATVAGWLLWLGRGSEAAAALAWLQEDRPRTADPAVRSALTTLHSQFPLAVPTTAEWSLPENVSDIPVELAAHAGIVAAGVLASALSHVPDDRIHARAEQVLVTCELSDETLPAITAALQTLVYTDRLDSALAWCTKLLQQAADRPAAAWQGTLGVLRAELALRRGNLEEALTWSEFAIDRISRRSWGVTIGLPLAVRLQALTGSGRLEEAGALARTVLPEDSFQNRSGLAFLNARALFHLSSNKFHLAQEDFARCAELSALLDSDLPALVPWRTGYARLHLRLQHAKAAMELMAKQLARPGGQGARVRGQSLCVVAQAGEPRRRPTLLREAIDLLQVSGDRAGLANALAELSTAYHELSEFTRARLMSRRAQEVAADCGTTDSCRSLLAGGPVPPSSSAVSADQPDTESADVLSDAERRVAELAVMGHTNREISAKLYITVSTVEQHLTRIYRKLGVTRRVDLPIELRNSDRGAALLSVAG